MFVFVSLLIFVYFFACLFVLHLFSVYVIKRMLKWLPVIDKNYLIDVFFVHVSWFFQGLFYSYN